MRRDRALHVLAECRGNEIWPVAYCLQRGVPETWVRQLADAFESGYQRDRETIYFEEKPINQFHGVRDLDLALRIGEHLGLDVARIQQNHLTPQSIVTAIRAAVEDE